MTTNDLEAFRAEARSWLGERLEPRTTESGTPAWGSGSDSVAIFHDVAPAADPSNDDPRSWHRTKYDAGWAALTWDHSFGGQALTDAHEAIFDEEEQWFEVPEAYEVLVATQKMFAPTLATFGTAEQQEKYIRAFLRADLLCCQLFSEPGAGSDLAGLSTKAVRTGSTWRFEGQKVWTSGANQAEVGLLIARSDSSVPKHHGMTAFIVPMDAPGVEVRPLRQMTGGSSFNEVFFDGLEVSDEARVGAEGEGWKVTLEVLRLEREASGRGAGSVGGSWDQVLVLAQHLGRTSDPVIRQELADLYIRITALDLSNQRVSQLIEAGIDPGPAASFGKLFWSQNLNRIGATVGRLLGPKITADTGEWGTYAWNEHLLGAPGYRIAGGADEIQRNVIGERFLGLPREPR